MGQNTLNNTKYETERVEKILSLLREGRHITHACALSGITLQTLYNWVSADEKGDERFEGFADLVREAKAIGELKLEDKVKELCTIGKNPDARTYMHLLSTKNREVYANLDKVELSGIVKTEISLEQLVDGIQEAKDDGK
jgi:hypothetical protein